MKNASASRAGWFQVSLKTLFVLVLIVAAFFGGWAMAQRGADKAIREAQAATDLARRQEEEARLELQRERSYRTKPCHPGCFPAGTLVRVLAGTMPIERIREGDSVMTVGSDGKPAAVKVVSVFITQNRLFNIQTDWGSLETTQTQPVCLEEGGFRPAGELKPGDAVWRWDGTGRKATRVREVTAGRFAQVFNLVLGDPTVFIAGDFLVRSKPPAQ